MIWLVLISALAVVGGAWFVGRTTQTRAIVAAAAVAGAGGYFLFGHPNLPDEPLAQRLETLDTAFETDPQNLDAGQLMAVIQKRALENPDAPGPHMAMGELLRLAGRPNEAVYAYQSALRRDPNYAPAMAPLADLRMMSSEDIDATTAELYRRASQADPENLRVAYLAAIGDWKAGKQVEARAEWTRLEAAVPQGDQRIGMFSALRGMLAPDSIEPQSAESKPVTGN